MTDCTISNASNEGRRPYPNYCLNAKRKCYHRGYEGRSIRKVPQIVIIRRAVIITLNVAQFIPTKHRYFSHKPRAHCSVPVMRALIGSKNPFAVKKSGSPIRSPSRTAITTSSVSCDRPSPMCCLQQPKKYGARCGISQCEIPATAIVSNVRCMGLHCHAEGSHLIQ
jgi:hypothetical protein